MSAILSTSSSNASGFAPVAAANIGALPPCAAPARAAEPLLPAAPPPRTRRRLSGGPCPRYWSFLRSAALISPESSTGRLPPFCAPNDEPLAPAPAPADVEAAAGFDAAEFDLRAPFEKSGVRLSDLCILPTCAFQ